MASIRTAVQVQDRMSQPLMGISNALNIVISSFERMQNVSSNAVDTASLQAARKELNGAEIAVNGVQQEIIEASQSQQKFNTQMTNGHSAADGLWNRMKGIAATAGAAFGAGKVIGLSDTISLTTARLNLMNDGLQTTEELQKMIYTSAQRSRGAYVDTAQVVAKLGILAGDAFSGNAETIAFAEQMNKQFKVGGASIQEQTAGMYQLTQAMAAGKLQGDEFRSIMENAPLLAQAIAAYTNKPMGALKEMSADGTITADIIKNAMFAAADKTNERFAQLPMTFGDIWTSFKNQATMAFEPVLAKINQLANSSNFQAMMDGLVNGMVVVAGVATQLFEIVVSIAGVLADNWGIIEPIIWGLVAAFVAYNAVSLVTNGIIAAQTLISGIAAAALAMQSGATFAATVAQYGLNAALYACPITWIIAGIIAIVAAFYAVVGAVNEVTGTTLSGTGMITGAIAVAAAYIWNMITGLVNAIIGIGVELYNLIATFANFFANVFNDPVGAILNLFSGMFDFILGIVQAAAKLIDTVLGSDMAGAVAGFRNDFSAKVGDIVGDQTVVMQKLNAGDYQIKGASYTDAFKAGYNIGENIDGAISDVFKTPGADTSTGGYGGGAGGTASDIADTANNTGKMADSLASSEEDLKYLRDLAEKDVINRISSPIINLVMNNDMKVNSDLDLDGIASSLGTKIEEQMLISAEGA